MVKAVVGEEIRLNSVEDRLSHSGLSSQVGLVIGKISTSLDKGFVFDLVPTPVNDAGEAASWITESKDDVNSSSNKKKGGAKPKSQSDSSSVLSIDKDWVAEHARQAVKGVAEAAPLVDFGRDERLLIHISPNPRRWTCRNCSLSSNITSSSLRPCDFKMGRVLSTLQKFKCIHNFDIRIPIFRENISSSGKYAGILRDVISSHAEELKAAKALVDGDMVNVDEQLVFDGVHEVEFLLPFMQHTSFQGYSQEEVVGVLVFTGSICSFAYTNSKEPISQALADIKGDIISSLHSRLDIVCDEGDSQLDSGAYVGGESVDETSTQIPIPQLQLQLLRSDSSDVHLSSSPHPLLVARAGTIANTKKCSLTFPRRVFVPWMGDTYICDYIQPSETLEVLRDHCVELMSMEAPTDKTVILELETESTSSITLSTNSFWETAMSLSPELGQSSLNNKSSEKSSVAGKQMVKSSNVSIIAAFLVLILSVIIGIMLFASRT